MATATIAEVRALTSWAVADISDANLTTLLNLASGHITDIITKGDSNTIKMAEIYLTAHFGQLRLEGNQVSMSQGGVSNTFATPTKWYQLYKETISGMRTSLIKKVY